jgi:LDH2 family malate/lactate/ureidoglycolate dehydrogenase
VEAFSLLPAFHEQIQEMIRHVKTSTPAPGFEAVLVPGELEATTRTRRMREGIPIEEPIWQTVQTVLDRFSVKIGASKSSSLQI